MTAPSRTADRITRDMEVHVVYEIQRNDPETRSWDMALATFVFVVSLLTVLMLPSLALI